MNRFKELSKNAVQILTFLALVNLYLVRTQLTAMKVVVRPPFGRGGLTGAKAREAKSSTITKLGRAMHESSARFARHNQRFPSCKRWPTVRKLDRTL